MTFMIETLVIETGAWNFIKRFGNKIYKAITLYSAARAANELSRQGLHSEAERLIKNLKNN